MALITATIPLLLYSPISNFLFVNYDDPGYLNYHVRNGLTWENVKWAFTTYYYANWHPITWLAHMLDCQLFGLNPAGHHMSSLLLHCLNAVLLFLLLEKAGGHRHRSFIVAVLFAIHPLNVQSVAWISEKKNLLSTLFMFLTIAAYARYVRRPGVWRYLATLFLFGLGLMSKPMIITLPFLLLLLDYWPLERFQLGKKKYEAVERPPGAEPGSIQDSGNFRPFSPWLIWEKVPMFLFSVVTAVVTVQAQQATGAVTDAKFRLPVRVENAALSYVLYIYKMFWPVRLANFYPHPGNSIHFWQVFLAILFLLSVTWLMIWKKEHKYLVTGWLSYLGTLVPVIGLVQVGLQSMADRYAYIPLIGLFIIMVWGTTDLLTSVSGLWLKRTARMLMACILAALATDTRKQMYYWHDGASLFSHAIAMTPDNYTAHSKYAEALEASGRQDEALSEFESFLAHHPQDASASYNVAAALLRRGRIQEATRGFERTLALTQDPAILAHTHYQLGNLLFNSGAANAAEQEYRKAIELNSKEYGARIMLGVMLEHSGRQEEAIAHLRECATNMETPDSAYFYLGQAYESSGRLLEAMAAYQQALKVAPGTEQTQSAVTALKQKLHQ